MGELEVTSTDASLEKVLLTFSPTGETVLVPRGTSLLEACRQRNIDPGGLCGGRGKCAKCRMRMLRGASDSTTTERELLSEEELAQGWRLACRTALLDDAEVLLPPTPQRLLAPEFIEPLIRRDEEPLVREVVVEVGGAKRDLSYAEAIEGALSMRGISLAGQNLQALRGLGVTLPRSGLKARCSLYGSQLIDVRPCADTPPHALALDIGTTTISVALLDLASRSVVDIFTLRNPQSPYGADVVSRITYASQSRENLMELHRTLISALNEAISGLLKRHRLDGEDILLATVVGNSVMHHLFWGLEVKQMSVLPFSPVTTDRVASTAGEIGLALNPSAVVVSLPLLSGYVGADTVGVILATDLVHRKENVLAVDLGTNGEVVLLHRGQLFVCSTAAGPAFEGAQIACGMQAAPGAIVEVSIDQGRGLLRFTTVADAPPRGIAGTGLVDAVAELLRVGVIEASGRLRSYQLWPKLLRDRAIEVQGERGFKLAEGDGESPVYLSQADIRELQLAKAAIRAGASLLLREAGIAPTDLDQVLIAGAFGSYLNPRSALRIGLLPSVAVGKVEGVGNAALAGAILSALSLPCLERGHEIKRKARRLELSANPAFRDEFVSAMGFPEEISD